MKIIIEYDNNKLTNLSNELANLFMKNDAVIILNNSIPIIDKINTIKNNSNSFILSNRINNINTTEIIYPLRDNNSLAISLANNLSQITTVDKYYQLRSFTNTNLDYYEILRNYNSPAIMIKYDENIINNPSLAEIIYQSINNYLTDNNTYIVKSGDSLYAIARKYNT